MYINNQLEIVLPLSTYNVLSSFFESAEIRRDCFTIFIKFPKIINLKKALQLLERNGFRVKIEREEYNKIYGFEDLGVEHSDSFNEQLDMKKPPLNNLQKEGILKMASLSRCLNMDDTGTGKTYQTITALNTKFRLGDIDFLFILCPSKVINKWKDELLLFGNFAKEEEIATVLTSDSDNLYDFIDYKVIITSYDTFRVLISKELKRQKRGKKARKTVYDFNKFGNKMGLILDEAHKIKNPSSQIAAAVLSHKSYYQVMYALSATLAPNKFFELWSALFLIDSNLVEGSYSNFINKYYILHKIYKTPLYPREKLIRNFIDNELKHFSIKRSLQDTGIQSKRHIIKIPVVMSSKHYEYYKKVTINSFHELGQVRDIRQLKVASNLFPLMQLLCSDPSIVRYSEAFQTYSKDYEVDWDFVNDNTKWESLKRLIANHSNDKILIWTSHPRMAQVLYQHLLQEYGNVVTNSYDYKTLEELKENYQDSRFVIVSVGKFSTGLEFTDFRVSIFWDRDFSYVNWYQAIGRNYRVITKQDVYIYVLLFKNSIEIAQDNALENKQSFNDMIKKSLTNDEIADLILGDYQ